MSFSNNPSAGVYVREIDLSTRVANADTSIGAIIGQARKGPVNVPVLVTSVPDFIEIFGEPHPSSGYMPYCALQFLSVSNRCYVTRLAKNDLTAGAFLTVDDPTAEKPVLKLSKFDDGTNQPLGIHDPYNTLGFLPEDPATLNTLGYFYCASSGEWNNRYSIRIRPSNLRGYKPGDHHDVYNFHLDIFLDYNSPTDIPVETFLVSRHLNKVDGFGNSLYIEDVLRLRSKILRYKDNPYCQELPVYFSLFEFLGGGYDGDRIDNYDLINAWNAYLDTETLDINILINAGYTFEDVQRQMDYVARTRMDSIAILDMPRDLQTSVAACVYYRKGILNMESSYSAIYTPTVTVFDMYNGIDVELPISGHVAAIYALTDKMAAPWFAPAGLNRALLKVKKIGAIYNQGKRDALDVAQINMVRYIPGNGYSLWAQTTLQSRASALQNVNVRRLMNFLEKSLSRAVIYSVFDPNDRILRRQLQALCEDFLRPIVQGQGLYDYLVVCDETNNKFETIAAGDLILDVFVDPVIPAKRILLRATITRTGALMQEVGTI